MKKTTLSQRNFAHLLDSQGCRVSSTPVTIWLSSSGNDTFRLMYVFLELERKHDGPTGTLDRESVSKLLGNDLDFHSVITVGRSVGLRSRAVAHNFDGAHGCGRSTAFASRDGTRRTSFVVHQRLHLGIAAAGRSAALCPAASVEIRRERTATRTHRTHVRGANVYVLQHV